MSLRVVATTAALMFVDRPVRSFVQNNRTQFTKSISHVAEWGGSQIHIGLAASYMTGVLIRDEKGSDPTRHQVNGSFSATAAAMAAIRLSLPDTAQRHSLWQQCSAQFTILGLSKYYPIRWQHLRHCREYTMMHTGQAMSSWELCWGH